VVCADLDRVHQALLAEKDALIIRDLEADGTPKLGTDGGGELAGARRKPLPFGERVVRRALESQARRSKIAVASRFDLRIFDAVAFASRSARGRRPYLDARLGRVVRKKWEQELRHLIWLSPISGGVNIWRGDGDRKAIERGARPNRR